MEIRNTEEDWQPACETEAFEDEELMECRVGDQELLLVRTGSGVVACPAICPHMEERLAHGMVDGNVLTCTKHLWQWDLATGDPVGLAEERLAIAPTRIEGSKIMVNVARLECDGGACN